ncbi:hypothetical protein OH76DRAFT_1422923 [Lentinus brumalis]|uniref:Uncharacterized protein n=1 Tax=Lentinus brumalis TaxID=2498619 RepID=A0A371CN89_9APHY|nr:hypothetical protein OH76DRAFT_1422923 [Polyporus brumalis]
MSYSMSQALLIALSTVPHGLNPVHARHTWGYVFESADEVLFASTVHCILQAVSMPNEGSRPLSLNVYRFEGGAEGAPHITLRTTAVASSAPSSPLPSMAAPPPDLLPIAACRFNLRGINSVVYYLCQHPELANVPEPRLRAAAVAFLAYGATSDGNHAVPPHRFHQLYYDLNNRNRTALTWRQGIREWVWQAISDLVVIFERAGGSATMLIHTPATRPPGMPAELREVKMEVILPKVLMDERPEVGVALSRLIQYFAEHVAVPAMNRWDDANHTATWPTVAPNVTPGERGRDQPLVPQGLTPHHIIYGRDPDELDMLIAALHHTTAPPPIPGPAPVPVPPPALPTPVPVTAPVVAMLAAGSQPQAADPHAGGSGIDDWVFEGEDPGFISPVDKPYIKLKHGPDDPYTADELLAFQEAHYDSQGELKGKGKERDDGNHARVAATIAALRNRIIELEEINASNNLDGTHLAEVAAGLSERVAELEEARQTQEAEILGLRAALKNALSERAQSSELTTRLGSPVKKNRGYANDALSHAARASARPVPSSPSSISSVSSVSHSTASATPRQGIMSPTRTSTPATPSRSGRSSSARESGYVFGPRTHRVVEAAGLRASVHNVLWEICEMYVMSEWASNVQAKIPGCSADLARALAEAMANDVLPSGSSGS